ncbi:unnamed protein product [Vicia faba]|uniref:Uncharacterized protein n=1 Tax=Vicia faba TaxID=3906 RepID=A0AAV0Z9J7_VICFA|nr:unnamed protein product [Vicia faba]
MALNRTRRLQPQDQREPTSQFRFRRKSTQIALSLLISYFDISAASSHCFEKDLVMVLAYYRSISVRGVWQQVLEEYEDRTSCPYHSKPHHPFHKTDNCHIPLDEMMHYFEWYAQDTLKCSLESSFVSIDPARVVSIWNGFRKWMKDYSNIIQAFYHLEATKKHKAWLTSQAPTPLHFCLPTPELEIPKEFVASSMDAQPSDVATSELLVSGKSVVEDGSSSGLLKNIVEENPSKITETLDELKKTNELIQTHLDKPDERVDFHDSFITLHANMMKDFMARIMLAPPPNP